MNTNNQNKNKGRTNRCLRISADAAFLIPKKSEKIIKGPPPSNSNKIGMILHRLGIRNSSMMTTMANLEKNIQS